MEGAVYLPFPIYEAVMKAGLIDFVKIALIGIDIQALVKNENLDFTFEVSKSTGQIHEEKMVATYHTCKVTIITKIKEVVANGETTSKTVRHVIFTGSIHKMWNSLNGIISPNHSHEKLDKGFNGNEFTLDEVIRVRRHLEALFDCTAEQMLFQNIEIGANLIIDFSPVLFLNGLLYHCNKLFDYMHDRNSAQVKHNRYILKIYNKSFQYGMANNVLRVELKFLKMHDLKGIGIITFKDIGENTIDKALSLLVGRFDEVMAYDESIRKKELSAHEISMLPKYSNPYYWIKDLKPHHRDRHKKALKAIIAKHSDNRQNQIHMLLSVDRVMDNRHDEGLACVMNNQLGDDIRSVMDNTSNIVLEATQISTQTNCKEAKPSQRLCRISEFDISMQKEGSLMLSIKGIKHYLKTQPEVYQKLKRQYLTDYWVNADVDTQVKELAHNIRTISKNQAIKQRRLYPIYQNKLFDLE
jgi:hypothetical protein